MDSKPAKNIWQQKDFDVMLLRGDSLRGSDFEDFIKHLGEAGCRCYEARNLSSATHILKEQPINAIFMSVTKDVRKSLDVVTPIMAMVEELPAIAIIEEYNDDVVREILNNGFQDFVLRTDVDARLLQRTVRYSIERQRMELELEGARKLEQYLSYYDALTGLPNRQLFYDRLNRAVIHARRTGEMVAVMVLDLDGFKRINDTSGHTVGDKMLRKVADRLSGCIRESDTVARQGGDEFKIIVDKMLREQDAGLIAKKILQSLDLPIEIEQVEHFITTSIGISLYPQDGEDSETLVKNADVAMYRAKSEGKNNFQFYNRSTDALTFERLELENHLRCAIDNNELRIYYQPVFDVARQRITALEALIRWEHPKYGLVPPSKFIPLAEETGLIVDIGNWVIREACLQNVQMTEMGLSPLRVSVNLSYRQFYEKELPEVISEALSDSGLQPDLLGLEITESNVMQDIDHTIETLKTIQAWGIRIAIDDFGTGYSSLSYLKRLPIDTLKIDRSFVRGIPGDRDDMLIVGATIGLAHNLNLGVIAEGVETIEQLEILTSMHCDQIQGYYFSKPLDFERICKLLEKQKEGLKQPVLSENLNA